MSYDSKSVNIKKEVKAFAATMTNKEKRRAHINGFVKIAEATARTKTSKSRGDKDAG